MTGSDSAGQLSPARRFALSALHWAHWGALGYACFGWLIPDATALWVHMGFVFATLLQWLVNRDTCILDSIRSWLMTGAWRAKSVNPEEGRWIASQLERLIRRPVPTFVANIVIYVMIFVLGLLSWLHLQRLAG